jgi:hypothetical protein
MNVAAYIDRLAQYHQSVGIDYIMHDGTLWTSYRRMVMPWGPVSHDYSITASEERLLLAHFRKAVLLQYTDGFSTDAAEPSRWYSVTCHRFLDLGDYNAHFRNMIRRGLKNCSVQKVDTEYIANHGYEVYMASYSRYSDTATPNVSEEAWKSKMLLTKDYPDLREYWAVFVGDRLVGYAGNWILGTIEANYSGIRLHPQFLGAYSSYALFFKMNEYYLQERSLAYVNDGFRNIGHATNVQDFLVQKFGFQRTPTHLYVRYRPWVAAALRLSRLARPFLSKRLPNYAALCALDDARSYRKAT